MGSFLKLQITARHRLIGGENDHHIFNGVILNHVMSHLFIYLIGAKCHGQEHYI